MREPALIEIRNATIWRGTTCVFEDLNLRIEQHERVAILGPNGSGKTSLLKIINRELYPVKRDGSQVSILGRQDWNVWELRKRIGLVSHDLHQQYLPTITALEVVLSGFYSSIGVHGALTKLVTSTAVDAARRIMQELGIDNLRGTPLEAMSTGQQRRCLLARALVHNPATLILDEPTAGLDLAASFDYLSRLRKLAAAGCNILLVTHHLNEIPPEVERIVLLANGRIVADGDKEAVLTAATLGKVYETPMRVREVDGYYLAYPD